MHSYGVSLVPFLGLTLILGVTGCSRPGSLEVPRCPNPVLLGPVDRVGGHRAVPAPALRRLQANVIDYVPKPSTEEDDLAAILGTRASSDAKAVACSEASQTSLCVPPLPAKAPAPAALPPSQPPGPKVDVNTAAVAVTAAASTSAVHTAATHAGDALAPSLPRGTTSRPRTKKAKERRS